MTATTMTTKYRKVDWPYLVELYQGPSRRRPGQPMSATELWHYARATYGLGCRTRFTVHFRAALTEAGVPYRTHAMSNPGRPPAVERMTQKDLTWNFEFGHTVKERER